MARALGAIAKIFGWWPRSARQSLLLWKGPAAAKELEEAKSELARKHYALTEDREYRLPGSDETRHLLWLDRTASPKKKARGRRRR